MSFINALTNLLLTTLTRGFLLLKTIINSILVSIRLLFKRKAPAELVQEASAFNSTHQLDSQRRMLPWHFA